MKLSSRSRSLVVAACLVTVGAAVWLLTMPLAGRADSDRPQAVPSRGPVQDVSRHGIGGKDDAGAKEKLNSTEGSGLVSSQAKPAESPVGPDSKASAGNN